MIFAYGCTKSWYKYLIINLYSLLKNNPDTKKVYLLIETEDINDVPYLSLLKDEFNVEFVLINFNNIKKKYVKDTNPNVDTPYTDFAFCKLILPDVVEEDKVIYLDMDTIVLKDLSRLWYWDLGDNAVAGCRDTVRISPYFYELGIEDNGKYINTGVMLMDLPKLRKMKMIEKTFEILNKRELKYPDQDALNIVCQGQILYIPSIYNQAHSITVPVANCESVKVFHFARAKVDWVSCVPYGEKWYEVEEEFYFKYVHNKKS